MTNRAPSAISTGWPWPERSIVAGVLGLPGFAAIGIALGFTALGVFIDLERINGLGTIFKACYFTGCVLSVCWVKRRALFGPVVAPPLLLAVAVPAVVLAAEGGTHSAGLAAHLLSIGTPLLNGFPTMAVTTAFVLAIGIGRYLVQRAGVVPERVRRSGTSKSAQPERSRPRRATTTERAKTAARRSRADDHSDDSNTVLPASQPAEAAGHHPPVGRPPTDRGRR